MPPLGTGIGSVSVSSGTIPSLLFVRDMTVSPPPSRAQQGSTLQRDGRLCSMVTVIIPSSILSILYEGFVHPYHATEL